MDILISSTSQVLWHHMYVGSLLTIKYYMNDRINFYHLLPFLPSLYSTRPHYLSGPHFPYLKSQEGEFGDFSFPFISTIWVLCLVRKGVFHYTGSSFTLWLKLKGRNKETRNGKITISPAPPKKIIVRLEGTLDREALDQGPSMFCVRDKTFVFLKSKNVMFFSIV